MNAAHLHLILNHFPVVGLVFISLMLLFGLVRRNPELTRAGLAALVAIAIVTIPVYLTGEPAEEIVEHLPGVSEQALERHEEAAFFAMAALEILGAAALIALVAFRRPRSLPRWLAPTLLALTLMAAVWVGWTSSLGGQILHSEARPDFAGMSLEHPDD